MNTVLHIEVSEEVAGDIAARARMIGMSLNSFAQRILTSFSTNEREVADALRELESAGVAYCPYCDNSDILQPNEETLASFAEAREGKYRAYTSIDDLLADVDS